MKHAAINVLTDTMKQSTLADRYSGCLLGLACGDAVGTTAEFAARGSFAPIVDMIGGGPFGLPPGKWTDDTSMALCLAESLLDKNGFDPKDQMGRYVNWWQWGYNSSTGECFDIGVTVRRALMAYVEKGSAPSFGDRWSSGRCCRMARLHWHPVRTREPDPRIHPYPGPRGPCVHPLLRTGRPPPSPSSRSGQACSP